MPAIDKEYLTDLLADLKRQEQEGVTQAHRAHGAIMVTEALLKRLDTPALLPRADVPDEAQKT